MASQLINRVTFLASLVSKPEVIDPKLDKLRDITANLKNDVELNSHDTKVVEGLESEISDYLIHDEPLRKFTAESLKQSVFEHVEGVSTMRHLRRMVAVILAIAVILPVITMFFPTVFNPALRITIMSSLFVALLQTGATWLFLSAIKEFKSELRRAFIAICAALAILALSQLAAPFILSFVPTFAATWFGKGWNFVPFIPAAALLYIGARMVARVTNAKSFADSTLLLLGSTALAAVILVLLPHGVIPIPEKNFDIPLALIAFFLIPNLFVAIIMFKVNRSVTALYASPMRWFGWFITVALLGNAAVLLVRFVAFTNQSQSITIAITIPFVITGLLIMLSGYTFNKIARYR